MKTIKMPKTLLEAWLAALRSGEYAQGCEELESVDSLGEPVYCCLGVLQVVVDGHVTDPGDALPGREWLQKNEIIFLDASGNEGRDPLLPNFKRTASLTNDFGTPFTDIADAIADCATTY